MIDQERIDGALEAISAAVSGHRGHPVRWGIAWRDVMGKIHARSVLKSCREVSFEGTEREKRKARQCARIIRRGVEYAKQVDEVERAIQSLYPADEARRRLDEELGWNACKDESDAQILDRAMMRSRVSNPDPGLVQLDAHRIVRGRFSELELSDD